MYDKIKFVLAPEHLLYQHRYRQAQKLIPKKWSMFPHC